MINEALGRRRRQSKTEAATEASQLDAQLCSTTSCRCGRYEKLLSSTLLAIYSLEHGRTERLTGSWRLAWVTGRLFSPGSTSTCFVRWRNGAGERAHA
jgi:hypothetical protein